MSIKMWCPNVIYSSPERADLTNKSLSSSNTGCSQPPVETRVCLMIPFSLFVHLFFDVSFTNLLSVKTRKTVSTFMLPSFLMSYWFSMGNSVSVTHGSYRVSVLSVLSNSRLTNRTATLQPCIFVTQACDYSPNWTPCSPMIKFLNFCF